MLLQDSQVRSPNPSKIDAMSTSEGDTTGANFLLDKYRIHEV